MIMSILASVTSFNSGLLNTSRFAYAMSRDNVLPSAFSKLHPDYATPWVSILGLMVFALLVSLLILVTGKYLFIIVMAAALECFIYVVMAVCVIKLRRSMPDNPRDFKVPGGYVIPVITIIVFAGLLIGILVDKSRDYAGKVLFANYWVAVVMAAFFALCALYTIFVVPVFKKKAEAKAATRVKRRPGKISG
jgi:amino acid transporter